MILRRAANLSSSDNVRLEDGRLWNVKSVIRAEEGRILVLLTRTVGESMKLDLWADDLVHLAN
ncbi:MAG TPA: hypothetical protein VL614_00500 [Acetobacteraceae bacterium]|jgi:hypothetical protein|nr:hypothetical protein [Acetobacteraceae bacterium]